MELGINIPSKSKTIGRFGELYAMAYYKRLGIEYTEKCLGTNDDYDLLVNGSRIEVKTSKADKNGEHHISIFRNKEKSGETKFDFMFTILINEYQKRIDCIKIPAENIKKYIGIAGRLDRFERIGESLTMETWSKVG